jgi:acyl transferase domain-containing protein
VVREAPPRQRQAAGARPATLVLPLSAKTERALGMLAGRYAEYLAARPQADLADVCFTAGDGRACFSERLAVSATSVVEMQDSLRAAAAGQASAGVVRGRVASKPLLAIRARGRASIPGVLQLAEREPRLRALLAASPELSPFAVEYALARWWQERGVPASMLVAEGAGAFVAAVLAGCMSSADGARLDPALAREPVKIPLLCARTGQLVPVGQVPPRSWFEASAGSGGDAGLSVLRERGGTLLFNLDEGQEPVDGLSVLSAHAPDASATLFVKGIALDWSAIYDTAEKIALPTYPFARVRCWLQPDELRSPTPRELT